MPQPPHPVYHRTPFPPGTQPKTGWRMVCWLLIVFSPFIGFAIQGKVVEQDLLTGLYLALIPVGGLILLGQLDRAARRRIPADVMSEWRHGRLIPPEGAPAITPPQRYAHARHWLDLSADGVLISRSALLQLHGSGGFADHVAALHTADAAGQYYVPWSDITTWEVCTDSDGPNYHRLVLRPSGSVQVRRFRPDAGHEADLLDGVRAIGRVPVRLHDDLTAA
jgi:hypothetical protein